MVSAWKVRLVEALERLESGQAARLHACSDYAVWCMHTYILHQWHNRSSSAIAQSGWLPFRAGGPCLHSVCHLVFQACMAIGTRGQRVPRTV